MQNLHNLGYLKKGHISIPTQRKNIRPKQHRFTGSKKDDIIFMNKRHYTSSAPSGGDSGGILRKYYLFFFYQLA